MTATMLPLRKPGFWVFIIFMSALTTLFVVLGVWQMERLAWKEGLIADVTERLMLPAEPLPAMDQWPSLDTETWQFRPLSVTGHYIEGRTALVFISLSDAKGQYSGPGYWVMSAFELDAGGTVFINRGFIPQSAAADFAEGQGVPTGTITLTGTAIAPEAASAFTPTPDSTNRVEWVRDPARLAALTGVNGSLFPMTLDLPAGAEGSLPQGGETVVEFPNNHLGYALTWFGFAILTPCLLAFWIWRQLRPTQ